MKQDLNQIFELKKMFFALPFPKGLAGEEIAGIDLVLLDSDCAGLIDKFLGRKGTRGKLDQKDYQLLKELKIELNIVIPLLTNSSKKRFIALEELVDRTLTYIEQK